MAVDPDSPVSAQERANQAFQQLAFDHIHPKAKEIPTLYRQIITHLERHPIGAARIWSACWHNRRFQRFFESTDEDEKPDLGEFLAVKAVRDVVRHREGDPFAQHAFRRNLDEWAEGQLRAMTAESETSSEQSHEEGTRGTGKVKSEPRESVPPFSPQPEMTERADLEQLATPLTSSSNHPTAEPPKPTTTLASNLLPTPSSLKKRAYSRSAYPKAKMPRMVDEGSMAKVDTRDASTQTTDDGKEKKVNEAQELETKVAALVDAAIARRTQEASSPYMMGPRVTYAQDALPPRVITELPANEVMQYPMDNTGAYGRTIVPPRRPESGYLAPEVWERPHGRGMRGESNGFPTPDYGSMLDFAFGRVGYRR